MLLAMLAFWRHHALWLRPSFLTLSSMFQSRMSCLETSFCPTQIEGSPCPMQQSNPKTTLITLHVSHRANVTRAKRFQFGLICPTNTFQILSCHCASGWISACPFFFLCVSFSTSPEALLVFLRRAQFYSKCDQGNDTIRQRHNLTWSSAWMDLHGSFSTIQASHLINRGLHFVLRPHLGRLATVQWTFYFLTMLAAMVCRTWRCLAITKICYLSSPESFHLLFSLLHCSTWWTQRYHTTRWWSFFYA